MNPIDIAAFRDLFNRRDHLRYRYMTFFAKDAGVVSDKDGAIRRIVPPTKRQGKGEVEDLRVLVFERDRAKGQLRECPYPVRPNGIVPALLYAKLNTKGDLDWSDFVCFRYNFLSCSFEPYNGLYFTRAVAGQRSKTQSPIVKALYLHGGAKKDEKYRDEEGRNRWE